MVPFIPVAVKNDSEKFSPLFKGELEGVVAAIEEGIVGLCVLTTEAQRRREDQAKFFPCFFFLFSILLCVSEPLLSNSGSAVKLFRTFLLSFTGNTVVSEVFTDGFVGWLHHSAL